MGDILSYLPLIFQILDLIPKIQAELKAGTSVVEKIKTIAPEVLPILQTIGAKVFPTIPATSTAQAGALVLSMDMVRTIQTQLNLLKITDDTGTALTVDGSYGNLTKQAVTKFQKASNLTADGWAGNVTQAALAQAVAKLAP